MDTVQTPNATSESTSEQLSHVHKGTLKLPVGTLVEVNAGNDESWYGEINGYNGKEPLVTYIEVDEDNVYSFQQETYEAPKESINKFIHLMKGKKREAWKLLGFVYMGRFEIMSIDDMNSDDSDDEWSPATEEQQNADEDDDEEDDTEEDTDDEDDADDMQTETETEEEDIDEDDERCESCFDEDT